MSRLFNKHFIPIVLSLLVSSVELHGMITSLNKSDPFPVYTTLDPHTFNHRRKREILNGHLDEDTWIERFTFSASAFGQNAYFGKNIKTTPPDTLPTCDTQLAKACVELGDMLDSPWNMIPTVYGTLPQGKSLVPTLQTAQDNLFPGGNGLNSPNNIDPEGKFGFFSFPAEYRKRGARVEFDLRLFSDFGIKFQTGISDICFTVLRTINLNTTYDPNNKPCPPTISPDPVMQVNEFLMCKLKDIARELDICLENFNETSFEDVRLFGYWRSAYEVNRDRDGWPHFLLIPHFELGGTIGTGKARDPKHIFSIPFGNNGHNSVGFNVGLNLDFSESVEFGAEAGLTHFFGRCIQGLRVPNSPCQSGIYPFATDVRVQPGRNLHFGAKMSAYHFLERLSFYFQYIFINHDRDCISLQKPDPAFVPETLAKFTNWKVHLANIGFNYDLSPNVALGFLWQAPLMQQNAFRSTTVMFSFIATF